MKKRRYSAVGVLASLALTVAYTVYGEVKLADVSGVVESIHRSEYNSSNIIKNMLKLKESEGSDNYKVQDEDIDSLSLNKDFNRIKTKVLNTWVDKDEQLNINGVTYIMLQQSNYYNIDTLRNVKYTVYYGDKVIDEDADYNIIYSKEGYNNTQIVIIAIQGEYNHDLKLQISKGISNKTEFIDVVNTDSLSGNAYRIIEVGEDRLVGIKVSDDKFKDSIELTYNPRLEEESIEDESIEGAGESIEETQESIEETPEETIEELTEIEETSEESLEDESEGALEEETEFDDEEETLEDEEDSDNEENLTESEEIHDTNDELYTVNYNYSIYGKKDVLDKIIAGDVSMTDIKSGEEFIDYNNLQSKWDEYNLSNAYSDVLNVKLNINIKMTKSAIEGYIKDNEYTSMNKNQTIVEFKNYIARIFRFNIEKDDSVVTFEM